MNITINGKPHTHVGASISYEDVIRLDGHAPGRILSVTWSSRTPLGYRDGGILSPGRSAYVHEGMRFDCCDTSNA